MKATLVVGLVAGLAGTAWATRPTPASLSVMQAGAFEYEGKTVRVSGYVGCVHETRWCLLFAEAEGLSESMTFDAAALPTTDYARALRCGLGSSEPRCPAVLTGRMKVSGEPSNVTLAARSVVWNR